MTEIKSLDLVDLFSLFDQFDLFDLDTKNTEMNVTKNDAHYDVDDKLLSQQ